VEKWSRVLLLCLFAGRYKPAQCGQMPIRVETSMYFDFWH
jgi:hypothetical protein